MGKPDRYKEVNLFSGLIFSEAIDPEDIKNELRREFSEIDLVSDKFEFDFTDYYNSEMGKPLFRQFISFCKLINPESLSRIKIVTNSIENKFSKSGKRVVNIDPGYISDANVIIATTKNHYHRVHLREGIYAHIEYVIKGKNLSFLEWTYPDFRSGNYLGFFNDLNSLYKNKIKRNK